MLPDSILNVMLVQVVRVDNLCVYGHTCCTHILIFFSYAFFFPKNK